jgi:hypothetical protein
MNPAAGQHLNDRRQLHEQPTGGSAGLTADQRTISGPAASRRPVTSLTRRILLAT